MAGGFKHGFCIFSLHWFSVRNSVLLSPYPASSGFLRLSPSSGISSFSGLLQSPLVSSVLLLPPLSSDQTEPRQTAQTEPRQEAPVQTEASSAQTGPSAQTGASVTECVTNYKCFIDKKCVDKEMYGRNNAGKLSLSIDRNGDFDKATSITIINNDKFGKTLSSIIVIEWSYRSAYHLVILWWPVLQLLPKI